MSVYLDHFYIKPTKQSYPKLKEIFKEMIGEEIFQYGEFEVKGKKWAGFYVHFEKGTFLEILDPELCDDVQAVGLCMSSAKEYRGHFLKQIKDILDEKGKEAIIEDHPEDEPTMSTCKPTPKDYISVWGVEYSDRWEKEWGSDIARMGLLSPLESFMSASFIVPEDKFEQINESLFWIDERFAQEVVVKLPLKTGNSTSVTFVKGMGSSCVLSFVVDKETEELDISQESFTFKIRDGIASLSTKLEI